MLLITPQAKCYRLGSGGKIIAIKKEVYSMEIQHNMFGFGKLYVFNIISFNADISIFLVDQSVK